ncbi:MAG: hypothetical protein B5766_10515 [Candidatus Lumbricidophila eiseniae]|uniref:Cell wall synthesis protein Wag31 n=1 Tax=Candidatus Lumbricidiphila eiseniae TaxID=1969409 RepID=A0A2A6FPJ8_9MICO|nr:MAG: hypothetical protein B5766_10515 [Candidatus Lumbricidophila eiseniae]
MALTPDDVVNKSFEKTKFREGYDQDQVDDFLDEVVIELRRLAQENEQLRERVTVAESKAADAVRSLEPAKSRAAQVEQEVQALRSQLAEARAELSRQRQAPAAERPPAMAAPTITAAPVAAIPGSLPAPLPAASASPTDEERDSANLLQLARRLHEEHVREGINKRDALIAEGKATAARIGSDAEASMRSKLVALEQERVGLQRRVDELRTFEHDYRRKLRAYIEGQLQDLDSASVVQARATGTPGTPFPGSVA